MDLLTFCEALHLPVPACASTRPLTAVPAAREFTPPLPIVGAGFLFAFTVLLVLVGCKAVTDVVLVDLSAFCCLCRVVVGAHPSRRHYLRRIISHT
jgi:hypothetical protein